MTPIEKPTTVEEKRFNERHIKTRNTIERCFGVWKKRFPCLNHIRLKLETTLTVIVAVGVLHNICRRRNDIFEDDRVDVTRAGEMELNVNRTATLGGRAKRAQIIATHCT